METEIEPVTVKVSGTTVLPAEQKKAPVRHGGNYRTCSLYHARDTIPCIMHDLCMKRDVEYCPVRTKWSQNIGEPDVDFEIFCGMHPAGGV